MSLVSDALAAALAAVATARGEVLGYRASTSGSFTTLTGFVLDRDDPQVPAFGELEQAEESARTGRLSGPLTPVMVVGYQIQDGSSQTWAVETVDLDQQQLCTVKRVTVAYAGPDRGGAS